MLSGLLATEAQRNGLAHGHPKTGGSMSPAEGARSILDATAGIEIQYLNEVQRREWCALVSTGLWACLALEPSVARWLEYRTVELGRLLTVTEVASAIVDLLAASVVQPQAPLVVQEGTDAVQ